jgi:UDP-N-acetylglucosamine--N-acetylmuramyl-(pentapeptide) pyrophosphoryl-undecaprenol N-acetylglucosamine transferase
VTRTVLILAGGTGGHIMPGLAVADELRAAGWRISWLGAIGGMEERLVPMHGFELASIGVRGFRGRGLFAQLSAPFLLLRALWSSYVVIKTVRPDVVLGMGGYVAFPGGLMAALLRYPLAIHEQNAIPGMTNRLLGKVAKRLMGGFPGALRCSEWTGNPVSAGVHAIENPKVRYVNRRGPLNVLVVGGSLGAAALNQVLPQALALIAEEDRPRVVHQAGARHLDSLRLAYANAGVEGELLAFIDNMAERYALADLVICRAGAMTISEICAAGIASILVPFPFAVDDHQTANARFLVDRGAAILIPQSELTPKSLARLLSDLTRAELLEMAEKSRAAARPDAAAAVARRCIELARVQA